MFRGMFAGRYGIDRYSVFLAVFALIFLPYPYIWIVGVIIIGYAIFRAFSRNFDKRRRELYKFDEINRASAMQLMKLFHWFKKLFHNIKNRFQKLKIRLSQRKQYLFLKCTQCKKTLRLPRHKGKLQATCPLCGTSFMKKT
jgi:uncharacterized membrane-anchored protein YhcB (DUF1043 family)